MLVNKKDMTDKNNGAKRLLQILERAKTITGGNSQLSGLEAWAEVFDIPKPDSKDIPLEFEETVVSSILQLRKLVDEVEEELRRFEGLDLELYLRPFSRLRYVTRLAFLTNNNFYSVLAQLTEGDMTVLAFCVAKMAELPAEPIITEEQLKELSEDVNALYAQVLESSLENELRTIILDRLQSIKIAIHQYHIRGIVRLREELEKSIGVLVLNEDLIKQSNDREEVKRFGNIVTNLATYISIAANVSKLAEMVTRYLPK